MFIKYLRKALLLESIILLSYFEKILCTRFENPRWLAYPHNQRIYAPKGKGVEDLTSTEAISAFPGRGTVSFRQNTLPGQPVIVEVDLHGLTMGQYQLVVHQNGDISDYCITPPAWHLLHEFMVDILDDGLYWMVFKDRTVNLREHVNVIGKAISLTRKTEGRYNQIYGCEVIGLSREEETVSWRSVGKRIQTFNPVPQYFLMS